MNIIKFEPFRRLSDQDLTKEIFEKMALVCKYNADGEYHQNWNQDMILDNLIKEGKRRKIILDNKSLASKILIH